jgi:hypothetical protein
VLRMLLERRLRDQPGDQCVAHEKRCILLPSSVRSASRW